MRAAKRGTVGRVRGREGSPILEGGETYASAGGHGDGNALYHNERWQEWNLIDECLEWYWGLALEIH